MGANPTGCDRLSSESGSSFRSPPVGCDLNPGSLRGRVIRGSKQQTVGNAGGPPPRGNRSVTSAAWGWDRAVVGNGGIREQPG